MMSNLKTIGNMNCSAGSCKLQWTIPKFPSYTAKDSKYQSQSFAFANSQWFIKIWPNGFTDDTINATGYVSLYLHQTLNQDSGDFNFAFGILSTKGIMEYERKWAFQNPACGWDMFILKSKLLERRSELLPSNNLTIVCLIEKKDTSPDSAEHGDFIEDFKSLYISKDSADVVLKIEDRSFPAHRTILAARSPVFNSMFKTEMVEKETGVVKIADCDESAFDIFLLFLYSGEVDFKNCSAFNLYKISDKYEVLKLKSKCVDFMIKNLSCENFYEISVLADQFNESKLLTEVQCFFNKNFKELVSSKTWESFLKDNFRLGNNLLREMALKVEITQ